MSVVVVCACALACALPARAQASRTVQMSLMDDQELIYSPPAQVEQALQRIASLGVDRVKVSVVWSLVAPASGSKQRPNFNATDPNAYPAGAWSRYDTLVRDAQALGLRVYFQFDPPVPEWAVPAGQPVQSGTLGSAPDPTDFEQFVEAVGDRYSGSFVPTGATAPLPRVSFWSVWNEPDIPAWLSPWFSGNELLEPSLYRSLVNAAWNGLEATSHTPSTDTILIGETANSGVTTVEAFVRNLYCVNSKFKPLTGQTAANVGCPASGSRASFMNANPGLFQASGFAHHPYSFNLPPNKPYPLKTWVTLYNLNSLEHILNGIFSSYSVLPPGGVPMYLTEFGYESDPPNPFVRNSTAQQATWLNQADYMAYNFPYVRMMNQFELVDSAPTKLYPAGSYAYWTTSFQTGLEFLSGQPKPAFAAFRIPIWLPVARHGRRVIVWGQLRAANHSQTQSAEIQLERNGSSSFRGIRAVQTSNSEGFLQSTVAIPAAGLVRIAWRDPATGAFDYSRDVRVK